MQLSNRHFQAEFCNQRSNLLALRLRRGAGTADWSDRPGSVTIIDDRKRRSYSDVDQSIQASTCKTRTKVTTTKQIKGAEFALKETWHLVGDTLRWDLEITLAPGAKARSIQVRQLLPIPDPAYGINVWTARADFPTTIERLAGLDLQYHLPAQAFVRRREQRHVAPVEHRVGMGEEQPRAVVTREHAPLNARVG